MYDFMYMYVQIIEIFISMALNDINFFWKFWINEILILELIGIMFD